MELENVPINTNTLTSHGSTEDNLSGANDISNNDEVPLDGTHLLTVEQVKFWRKSALVVAWTSVIVLFVLGCISFGVSIMTESAATFGFAFDCILDVCTSAVVIWRFYGSLTNVYSERRERIALLFLASFFLIASFAIIVRDITEVLDQTHTKNFSVLYTLAAVSGTVCLFLALFKFVIAKKLESKAVKSDGYSSLAGAVTGFSILVSSEVSSKHPTVWYLDNVVGFCIAFLLFVYGIMLLTDALTLDACPCSRCCWKDPAEKQADLQEKQVVKGDK
ncbi:transmembrane protein 163a-like [Asterias amurensis]|uniref:transmembrane protein 163a-like n=1 Tax=Asterias amurensis TaxID=7602 RepID=UPI003AB5E48F